MTDCKIDDIWESAKRRKAMNGFSVSIELKDRVGGEEVFSGSQGILDEDVIVSSTKSRHIRSKSNVNSEGFNTP